MRILDIATLGGIVVCFILVIFGIVFDKNVGLVFGNITAFIDIPSVIITIGGTFACLFTMSGGPGDLINKLKGFGIAMKKEDNNVLEAIQELIRLSNIARKEGLLALEESANNIEDPFIKKGLMLVVDGTEPELVSSIMESELSCLEARHKDTIGFWENVAAMGPAWGMIGTLIGLVNMLKALDDPSSIGPSMSVALITTLYGSLLANWIGTPIANKLKTKNAEEILTKEILVEGILSIQAGENPRVIEEKLKTFIAPVERYKMGESA